MDLRKTSLATAMGMVLGGASMMTQAALTSSAVLVFDTGVGSCPPPGGTYPNCGYGPPILTGSWFGYDGDGSGTFSSTEKYPITASGGVNSTKGSGIAIHETFDNTGNPMNSHPGAINGSENPQFSIWEFLGDTGMHYLTSPMTDLGLDTNGDHLIDMTGWTWTWSGIDTIPLGGDPANFASDTGTGIMSCSTPSCSFSSTFSLDYDAHFALGDPSGFGGSFYSVHLEGTIGQNLAHVSVPAPAATWLFGSGLIGLMSVARRKKKQTS